MEAQAERCAAVSPACTVLGVQAAARHRAADRTLPARQGQAHGVQGQAGLCGVPRPRAPRGAEEARAQGADETSTVARAACPAWAQLIVALAVSAPAAWAPSLSSGRSPLGCTRCTRPASMKASGCSPADACVAWLQGIVYGKPVHQGVTQLKPTRNLRSVAEERAGRKLGGLRVLNSYWVNQARPSLLPVPLQRSRSLLPCCFTTLMTCRPVLQDSTYKYYEVILIDIAHKAIRQVGTLSLPASQACMCALRARLPRAPRMQADSSHGGPAGRARQLDREPCAQAPRAARADQRRQEVPRPAPQGSRCQQGGRSLSAASLVWQDSDALSRGGYATQWDAVGQPVMPAAGACRCDRRGGQPGSGTIASP